MQCQYCDMILPDGSMFCAKCGKATAPPPADGNIRCPCCGGETPETSNFCTHCKHPISKKAIDIVTAQKQVTEEHVQIQMQSAQLAAQQKQIQLMEQQQAAQLKCPKCGSTSLSGNKKGFGIGKAMVGYMAGGLIAAPVALIGLTAGNIGAKKVRVTCMNCGKKFMAGKK